MDAFIIDAVRTPFGKYRGGLSNIRTDDLAAMPIEELVRRHPEIQSDVIDDVFFGNTNGAGEENRNVARMAVLLAGLSNTVPGVTINRLCASGSEALIQGARALACGDASVVIAGGVESMSRAPFVLPRPEEPLPRDIELHPTVVGWRMVNPRFPDHWTRSLGSCSEQVAERIGVTRREQDEWALRSHLRAHAAWEQGLHDDWVMTIPGVGRDESIRQNTNLGQLERLAPAFTTDGTVTAGNSSPLSDGAIAILLSSREWARRHNHEPLGRLVATATVALEPSEFARAPVPAINKLLTRAGCKLHDIAVIEIQEAFAAVVCVCLRELAQLKPERVNPNGGAIAIGHPLGASAPRLVIDLCRELRRRGGGFGIAAVCVGVGLGQALLVEVSE